MILCGLKGRVNPHTMPQSLSRILVHLIFSTKDRVPVLTPAIRSELHPYLAVVLRDNDCPSLRVGGAADHVHLFFGLARTLPVAKVVEIVKTSSSKWTCNPARWAGLRDAAPLALWSSPKGRYPSAQDIALGLRKA